MSPPSIALRHHYYHGIMDNSAATNTNKAHGNLSFLPSEWIAGLMERGQEEATISTANDAEASTPSDAFNLATTYVPITSFGASILTTFPNASTSILLLLQAGISLLLVPRLQLQLLSPQLQLPPPPPPLKRRGQKKTTTASTSATAATSTATTAAACSTQICNWAAEQCYMICLPPIKCQRSGCQKFAHHVFSMEWVTKNNLPEEWIGMLC